MVTGLAALLLARIIRELANSPAAAPAVELNARWIVERYVRGLSVSFGEMDTIDTVAQRLGLSRRRFTQLFREITGESWLPCVRRIRLQHAKHLLLDTGHSVTAIAFESGFEDLSNFHRVFKAATRLPPQAWRQRHQKRNRGPRSTGADLHRDRV
jgi:AraC family L-rhamnose operon regulatory protein RhaS